MGVCVWRSEKMRNEIPSQMSEELVFRVRPASFRKINWIYTYVCVCVLAFYDLACHVRFLRVERPNPSLSSPPRTLSPLSSVSSCHPVGVVVIRSVHTRAVTTRISYNFEHCYEYLTGFDLMCVNWTPDTTDSHMKMRCVNTRGALPCKRRSRRFNGKLKITGSRTRSVSHGGRLSCGCRSLHINDVLVTARADIEPELLNAKCLMYVETGHIAKRTALNRLWAYCCAFIHAIRFNPFHS